MEYNINDFKSGLNELEISLSESQMGQFLSFYEILIEKNRVMNLTSITDFGDVIKKHFLDSLSVVRVFKPHGGCRVLDLGTGAGFPGIPLKIAFPEIDLTLVDSTMKKVRFLEEASGILGLSGISFVHGRAEVLGRDASFRESFDLCLSRAVANMSVLSEYCLPLVQVGGCFIAYKSRDAAGEAASASCAIGILGGRVEVVDNFSLCGMERTLIKVCKERGTPREYPRKSGVPKKSPL